MKEELKPVPLSPVEETIIDKEAENYIQSLPEEIWCSPTMTNIKDGFIAGVNYMKTKSTNQ